jgi:hypothetical protein
MGILLLLHFIILIITTTRLTQMKYTGIHVKLESPFPIISYTFNNVLSMVSCHWSEGKVTGPKYVVRIKYNTH